MTNFTQRILTGSLFIIAMLVPIGFGPYSSTLLFLVISLLSLHEFYSIIQSESCQPNRPAGYLAALCLYGGMNAPHLFPALPEALKGATLAYPAFALVLIAELYRKKSAPFTNIGYTILGALYTVLPFSLLNDLSFLNGSYDRGILLGYFFLLWSSDSFAYVFGNLMGKTRLFERISPKKSWEGSIGGGLTTLVIAWLISRYQQQFGCYEWLGMAVIIIVTGTLGDLVESLLKRSLHVKDSGGILPGHGGLLDRFDALLISVPFLWAFLRMISAG